MSDERVVVAITDSKIDAAQAASIARDSDGAMVTFLGIVRDNTDGDAVEALEYEAYDAMATTQMRQIADEAISLFDVGRVMMIHRVGHLDVGEASVLVAVSAPHRGAAFDACEHCIDQLKERVPIWKKEIFASGDARWVNHP